MSFFNFNPETITGKFEGEGGEFEPIPAKTWVLAMVEDVKWHKYEEDHEYYPGEEMIKIKWDILSPNIYKNRKLFQNIRINHTNDDKKAKALNILGNIDFNAGGKLAKCSGKPTDQDLLSALVSRSMQLHLMVFGKNNWIKDVAPKGESIAQEIQDDDISF